LDFVNQGVAGSSPAGGIFLSIDELHEGNAMNKCVGKARAEYEQAARNLIEAVKVEYPIGCVVLVIIGRSAFEAQIVGHSESWWCNPGDMWGKNIRTGKLRRFSDCNIREE